MFVMREPDTPGGFNESMPCRPASSSATTVDAMVEGRWVVDGRWSAMTGNARGSRVP